MAAHPASPEPRDGDRRPDGERAASLEGLPAVRAAWSSISEAGRPRIDGQHDLGRAVRPGQEGPRADHHETRPTAPAEPGAGGKASSRSDEAGPVLSDAVIGKLADEIVARISRAFELDPSDLDGSAGDADRQAMTKPDSGPFLARRPQTQATPDERAESAIEDILGVGRAIADRTRIRILKILADEPELNVRSLCKRLRQSQPSVSHHLAQMRSVGLVTLRRDGKNNYYCLQSDRLTRFLSALAYLGLFSSEPCDDESDAAPCESSDHA